MLLIAGTVFALTLHIPLTSICRSLYLLSFSLSFVLTFESAAMYVSISRQVCYYLSCSSISGRRSQWPCGLRRRSTAARLLRLWVRIPPWAWMSVCCECCVLSGRGLCDELITRLEESYRLWCVVVCDLETSWMRRPWPTGGFCARNKQTNYIRSLGYYWSIGDNRYVLLSFDI